MKDSYFLFNTSSFQKKRQCFLERIMQPCKVPLPSSRMFTVKHYSIHCHYAFFNSSDDVYSFFPFLFCRHSLNSLLFHNHWACTSLMFRGLTLLFYRIVSFP